MVTPIELADTAIKIGLGALISGVVALLLAKASHERDLEKERIRRRRDLLEAVAISVETFSHAAIRNWSSARYYAQAMQKKLGEEELKRRRTNLAKGKLFDAFKEEANAGAKLRLLGELECYRLLDEYVRCVKILDAEYINGQAQPIEFLDKYRATLHDKKAAFFNSLGSVYKT